MKLRHYPVLIELAKDMREASGRGEKLNLSEGELACYDALEVNDGAVKGLHDCIGDRDGC